MFSSREDRINKFNDHNYNFIQGKFVYYLGKSIVNLYEYRSKSSQSVNFVGSCAAWIALGILTDIFVIYKTSYIYPERFYLGIILLAIALAVILYFTWPAVVGTLGIGFIGVMMSPTVNFAAATTLCCLTYFFGGLFSLSVVGNLMFKKNKPAAESTINVDEGATFLQNPDSEISDNESVLSKVV